MLASDTSDQGLEAPIAQALTTDAGYLAGDPGDRDHAVDLAKLLSFLQATQPEVVTQLALDEDGLKRLQFIARLQRGQQARPRPARAPLPGGGAVPQ